MVREYRLRHKVWRSLAVHRPLIEVLNEDDSTVECGPRLLHELPLRSTEEERADLVLPTGYQGDHAAPKTLC